MKAAETLSDGLETLEQIVRPVIWRGNFAQSIVGMYSLEATDKGIVWGVDGIRQNHMSPCDDIPTAKARVDEHYRARIASALNLNPILSEIKRMREALADPRLSALEAAFMEGRESTFGTDRHYSERAWQNSRTRHRALSTLSPQEPDNDL